jgi:hypothetical protein
MFGEVKGEVKAEVVTEVQASFRELLIQFTEVEIVICELTIPFSAL